MDESTGTPPSESKHPPRQRRVQWASLREDNIHSPQALDELGQDPDAFETLKEALERHKSIRSGNAISELTPEGPSSTSASGTPFHNISTEAPAILTTQLPGVYVAPHETDGLPTNSDAPDNVSPRARATVLVKAHKTGRFAFLRKRTKPRTNTPNVPQQLPATDIEKGPATSVGPQTIPPGRTTGGPGVLSSLLSLYEHRHRSGTSTPTAYSTDDQGNTSPSEDLSRQSRTSSGDTLSRYFLSNHPRSNASGPSKSPPGTPPLTIARAIKEKLPSSTVERTSQETFVGRPMTLSWVSPLVSTG